MNLYPPSFIPINELLDNSQIEIYDRLPVELRHKLANTKRPVKPQTVEVLWKQLKNIEQVCKAIEQMDEQLVLLDRENLK